MHAARMLWSGLDPSHVSKPRFSPIETGLCRMLNLDFRDPPLRTRRNKVRKGLGPSRPYPKDGWQHKAGVPRGRPWFYCNSQRVDP
jgi:hypothetical protein